MDNIKFIIYDPINHFKKFFKNARVNNKFKNVKKNFVYKKINQVKYYYFCLILNFYENTFIFLN